jgi:FtsH-binding integral membrane protein
MFAIDAAADVRAAFIRRTYAHLAVAVLAFVGLECLFLNTPAILNPMLQLMGRAWWAVLIGFMIVGWVADKWAQSDTSIGMQYLGLALYTLAESIIFVPLLYIAGRFGGPGVIPTAGIITAVLFLGMTIIVLMSGADFSFLRTGLCVAGLAATGLVVCSLIFGFSLGIFFSAAMAILACGYVLYYTSAVLHHYRTDQHVAAALALFAAVALLFWYIVRIMMELQRRD